MINTTVKIYQKNYEMDNIETSFCNLDFDGPYADTLKDKWESICQEYKETFASNIKKDEQKIKTIEEEIRNIKKDIVSIQSTIRKHLYIPWTTKKEKEKMNLIINKKEKIVSILKKINQNKRKQLSISKAMVRDFEKYLNNNGFYILNALKQTNNPIICTVWTREEILKK